MLHKTLDLNYGNEFECNNESEFTQALKFILTSPEVQKVIASLLTYAKAG